MNSSETNYVEVDKTGRTALPLELISRYAIKPGSRIRVDEKQSNLCMCLPSRLAKLYVEPTNQCNLLCRTCIRNIWDEPQGMMSEEIFSNSAAWVNHSFILILSRW